MKGGSDPYKLNHFLKESIYVNCFNRLRFLAEVSTKLHKMHFFGQFKDRNSERKHGNQIKIPQWSVKYLNFGQKLLIWTTHHTFLES